MPLTCQWCYCSRRGRDAAAFLDKVQPVPLRGHWFPGSGWEPGWWGYGSARLLTPSWHQWSPAAWRETDGGGLGNAPPEQRRNRIDSWTFLSSCYKLKHLPRPRPPTSVMLLSVSLQQAERSSSCSLLRAKSEAPSCCLNCSRSLCVTSLGRSSNGKRGGLKKPMLPKVRVNLGPLSPCWDKYII